MKKHLSLSRMIGNKIRDVRVKKGLSQEEFAAIVNSDRTYICKIENGQRNLTVWKLCEICEKSGITLKEFFNNTEFSERYSNEEVK